MKHLLIVFLFFSFATLVAQTTPAFYRITFKNKENNTYSVSNPASFLSQRSISKRVKYNIPISLQDLPITESYLDSVRASGCRIINKSKWFNSIIVEISDSNVLKSLLAIWNIQSVNRVSKVFAADEWQMYKTKNSKIDNNTPAATTINYNKNGTSAVYKYNYGLAETQIKIHNGDILHQNGFNGKGLYIAVLDEGFSAVPALSVFRKLIEDNRILATKDLVNPGGDVYSVGSHGTYVLSVLASEAETTMVGTAPGAFYYLIRTEVGSTENLFEEDCWTAGAEYADSCGADIISSSLGYTLFDDSAHSHSYEQLNGKTTRVALAANIATQKGILVINSAGNSANKPWHFIGSPADADSIITVGAINTEGAYATFSSQGPTADNRIKPDLVAVGEDTYIATLDGAIEPANGTSFAAPVISGLAACLWQMYPNKTNMEIRNAILKSCSKFSSPDNLTGYGIPDLFKASILLHSDYIMQENYITAFVRGSKLEIIASISKAEELKFSVLTISGNTIQTFKKECIEGLNFFTEEIKKTGKGIHLLTMEHKDGKKQTVKLLLLNN